MQQETQENQEAIAVNSRVQTVENYENPKEYYVNSMDKTGNANSIGFFFFGFSTFLSCLTLVKAYDSNPAIFSFCFFGGGLVQFICGFLEWQKGNTVSANIFIGWGIYNIVFPINQLLPVWGWTTGFSKTAQGCTNLTWLYFATVILLGSFKGPIIYILMDASIVLLNLFSVAGAFAESEKLLKVAGSFGMIVSFFALYVATAFFINESYGKVIIPFFAKGEKIGEKLIKKH